MDTQSSPPSSPFRGKSRVHDDEKEPVGAPTALLIATARLDVLRWCAQADPRNPLPTVEFRDRAPPCARHRPVDAACLGRAHSQVSHETRGALQGDALSLLAFGGSASSPSSAADFVEMQLVLRCGRCSGVCGCGRHSCSPAPAAHLPLPCVGVVAAAYFEVDERHHPHRGRARGSLRGGMRALSRRLRSPLVAATAAAGGCQGAWSCEAAAKAPVLAQARCSFVRAAWAVCLRASGGLGGAARLACSQLAACVVYGKKCCASLRISRVVCTSVRVPCAYLALPTLLCTRVCVVWRVCEFEKPR